MKYYHLFPFFQVTNITEEIGYPSSYQLKYLCDTIQVLLRQLKYQYTMIQLSNRRRLNFDYLSPVCYLGEYIAMV